MTRPTKPAHRVRATDNEGNAATPIKTRDQETVVFYLRARWSKSSWPREPFDPTAATPPLTMADVTLDSRIWLLGKGGSGPFERVLIRAKAP